MTYGTVRTSSLKSWMKATWNLGKSEWNSLARDSDHGRYFHSPKPSGNRAGGADIATLPRLANGSLAKESQDLHIFGCRVLGNCGRTLQFLREKITHATSYS